MINRIRSRIGTSVTFRYPAGENDSAGILRDRYVLPGVIRAGVPYWDVIDRIDFQDEDIPEQIRIGYFRAPLYPGERGERGERRLVWGSQTTIVESRETWTALLLGAAREKGWFWDIMTAVAQGLPPDRPGGAP